MSACVELPSLAPLALAVTECGSAMGCSKMHVLLLLESVWEVLGPSPSVMPSRQCSISSLRAPCFSRPSDGHQALRDEAPSLKHPAAGTMRLGLMPKVLRQASGGELTRATAPACLQAHNRTAGGAKWGVVQPPMLLASASRSCTQWATS